MKRLPLLINLILFSLLCILLSYWGMQIFKPKVRPLSAPAMVDNFEPAIGQWGNFFGQSVVVNNAPSNYQLRGVIVGANPQNSSAIVVLDGQPTFTVKVGKELIPGVKLQEVQRDHIIVSESGVAKRIELPQTPLIPGVNPVGSATAPKITP